jgi:hypothetical protein
MVWKKFTLVAFLMFSMAAVAQHTDGCSMTPAQMSDSGGAAQSGCPLVFNGSSSGNIPPAPTDSAGQLPLREPIGDNPIITPPFQSSGAAMSMGLYGDPGSLGGAGGSWSSPSWMQGVFTPLPMFDKNVDSGGVLGGVINASTWVLKAVNFLCGEGGKNCLFVGAGFNVPEGGITPEPFFNVVGTSSEFTLAERPTVFRGKPYVSNSPIDALNGEIHQSIYEEDLDQGGMTRTSDHWGTLRTTTYNLKGIESMPGVQKIGENFWILPHPVTAHVRYASMIPPP